MPRAQTAIEERYNVITHSAGFIFFFLAAVYFYITTTIPGTLELIAVAIYFICQITLYVSSTTYHYLPAGKNKFAWRKMDHISIYLSIAGTYTPVCLIALPQDVGTTILISVWSLAAAGLVWKLFFTGKYESLSSLLYLIMGWLIVMDLSSLLAVFNSTQLYLLAAGGAFFSIGIIFYAWNKLYFNHVIWHLFVLAGSLSHFFMILSVVD